MINIRRIIPILIFVTFFVVVYSVDASTIQNKYLLVSVDDETGRLFLSTIQGRPNVKGDEKKDLLFYDKPPSSYTLIYLDDDVLTFGDDTGSFKPPILDTESIKFEWVYQSITVTQELRFIKRKNSGIEDGVLIKYTVKNKDDHSHKIGFRILFDTYLGENSRYHFELSDGEKLKGEKSFDKHDMPNYWVSKDKKGVVCVRGVLKGNYVIEPDKVIFGNYKALTENLKKYYIKRTRDFNYPPYSRNDSAVALYYDPVKVDPGKTRTVYTVIGLCGSGDYESEKPVVVEAQPKKEALPKEEKAKSLVYHVKDYKAFKEELESISKLKKEISSIDELLEDIDSILTQRDAGESVDLEKLRALEKELQKY